MIFPEFAFMSAKLECLSPILWVKNLEETISFYKEVLGFTSASHFPNFATLTRDDIQIMIIVPNAENIDCENDDQPFVIKPQFTGSIYIFMKEVDSLWNEVKDKAKLKEPIGDREYLMRDFSIYDNNGYEIVFGEDISGRVV